MANDRQEHDPDLPENPNADEAPFAENPNAEETPFVENLPRPDELFNYTPETASMDTRTANRMMAFTQEGAVPPPEEPVVTGSTDTKRDPSTQRALHTPGIMPTVPNSESQLGADTSIGRPDTKD